MRRILICLLAASVLVFPARGAETRKYVALTFDDGPSGKYTQTLLDGLAIRGAKATFLLCGYRMKQYPELAQRIYDEGHEIGYHGYSHDSMETLSRRAIAGELTDSRALMPEGCKPRFFRPPGGVITDGVRQVAEAKNLVLLGWSVDPRDWETGSTAQIESAVLRNISDGDIVVLHDMTYSSVKAALNLVDALQAQGYRFVTVSELAKLRNTRLCPGKVLCKCPRQEPQPK